MNPILALKSSLPLLIIILPFSLLEVLTSTTNKNPSGGKGRWRHGGFHSSRDPWRFRGSDKLAFYSAYPDLRVGHSHKLAAMARDRSIKKTMYLLALFSSSRLLIQVCENKPKPVFGVAISTLVRNKLGNHPFEALNEVSKLSEQNKSFTPLVPTLKSHNSSSTTDNQVIQIGSESLSS